MKQILMAISLALLAATGRAEDKETAYLGVTVAPVEEELRTELKLPSGVGLLVEYVDENGPSAKVLEKHDVLHKFDDQLLVNHEQLQALLSTHQPGDIVVLTVIRNGQSRSCDVQLGGRTQHNVARRSHPENNFPFDPALTGLPDEIAAAMRRVLGEANSNMSKAFPQVSVVIGTNISVHTSVSISTNASASATGSASANGYSFSSSSSKSAKGGLSKDQFRLLGKHGFGTNSVTGTKPGSGGRAFSSTQMSTASSRVCVKSNERGTFTLTCSDGQKYFKAVGNDGKTLFDGPINTDEEYGKLSDDLKKELDALENNTKQTEPM